MGKNFDMENAVKLWERAQNVTFEPRVGELWQFLDLERENSVIDWLIEEMSEDGKNVTLVKKSGNDVGYRVVYDTEKLQANRWRAKDSDTAKYLWPCPNCEQNKPVPIGDYICEDCRSSDE